jgi:hypothetical protein
MDSYDLRARLLHARNIHVEKIRDRDHRNAGSGIFGTSESGVPRGGGFGLPSWENDRRLFCLPSKQMCELLRIWDPELAPKTPVHRKHLKTLFWDYLLRTEKVLSLKHQRIRCNRALRKALGVAKLQLRELPRVMKGGQLTHAINRPVRLVGLAGRDERAIDRLNRLVRLVRLVRGGEWSQPNAQNGYMRLCVLMVYSIRILTTVLH